MSNFIKSVRIKNLFDEKDINWELQKINVLVGKNGLGKSSILRLINLAVTLKDIDKSDFCDEIVVELENKEKYISRKTDLISIKTIELILLELSKYTKISTKNKNSVNSYSKYKLPSNKDLQGMTTDLFNKINEKNHRIADGYKSLALEDGNEKIKEKINVEFISTINMSANSVNTVTESDGNKTIFLDLEINNEIKRLNKDVNNKKLLQDKLTNSLNKFFEETNKKTVFIDDEIEIRLINGKVITYQNLSSGERQLLFIFLKIINGGVDNSLILMDEPEISLHLSWQEKLLTEITNTNSSSQMIIVTHSPAMVMDGWLDNFIDIKTITKEVC